MPPRLLTVALVVLAASPDIQADGFKFGFDGRPVPEREQRALIEWADGTETLYVAALSDPTSEGSVWVVPVRAEAAAVRAEPVDEFPAVTYYQTLKADAERRLQYAVSIAGLLDSGGLCCMVFMGGCGGGAPASKAVEASRVEKLGMVVTVVTADSRAAITSYLQAQGVNAAGVDLSSLEPYFGKGSYAFACGWVSKRGEPVTATGLRLTFPSPTLWFPLLPTRAYTTAIETVVYARGFVKPAEGCDLPDLHCRYIYGAVEPKGVGQAFTSDRIRDQYRHYPSGDLERLTRVTLTSDPQKWDRDLELVPGTTPVGTVALAVTGWLGFLAPLWSALLGAALGLMIPRLTIPGPERRWKDWVAGSVTGAAITLSIWASAVVFSVWRWYRFRDGPNQPGRYVVLPALAVAHFAVVFVVCHGLRRWIATAG